MGSEQFSLSWDDFHKTLSSGMNSLYENENLVDVTLAIDGKYLKAHKIVLSVCSTYFRTLFNDNPCKHPIVFLKDVSYDVMNYLLTFIYKGEVQVGQEDLASFIATAEALQIKGLTNNENEKIKSTESKSKSKRSHSDDNKQKKSSCPLPKKVKLIESNPLDVPTSSLDSKTDSNIQHLVSQQPQNPTNSDENAIECIQIQPKMEQFYHNENEQDENNVFDETQGDIYTEEVYQDNMGGDNCEFFDTVDSKPGASQADQTQDDGLENLRVGIPRRINVQSNYFQSMDEQTFFKKFRLTRDTVLFILTEIERNLEYPYDKNNSVSPINQILIALRFYATGNQLLSIADFGGTHVSTVCRIIKRVSVALAKLCPKFIKFPDTNFGLTQIQQQFLEIAAFPKIVGVIDCTHIKIQSPGGSNADIFRNKSNYSSINVQAISDPKMKILDLVARWPGAAHDATIFNNSRIKTRFENHEFGNGLLLGGSSYNIRPYLLTPIQNPEGPGEQRYNESFLKARAIVENLFRLWKRRFPILAYGSRLKLENTQALIVATAVLHNIAVSFNEEEPPLDNVDELEFNQFIINGHIPPVEHIQIRGIGDEVRRNFINEFFPDIKSE